MERKVTKRSVEDDKKIWHERLVSFRKSRLWKTCVKIDAERKANDHR